MKLLIVTPTYPGYDGMVGGAENYVQSLTKSFLKSDKINKITLFHYSKKSDEINIQGKLHRYCFKTKHFKNNILNPFPVFTNFLYLDWDILYLHQFNTWLTFFFSIWAKILGKKIILTDHNGGGINYNKKLGIDKLIDINFHTSDISKNDNQLRAKKNLKIYGGVDHNFFSPNSLLKRNKDFLFVGRLHPIKGIEELITASKACEKNHTLTLVLSTEKNEYFQTIQELINSQEQITIKLNLPKDDVREQYRKHKWILLPSLNLQAKENLGLTILEGMACGARAACSPYCGVSEMKSEYPTDDLIITTDWHEFFNNMTESVQSSTASDWASKHANWNQVSTRILNNI